MTYEIVPALGELAVDFAWRLVQYADATNAPHTGVFNGTTMLAHPGDRARQADRARAVRERWQENRAWMVGERKA